MPVKTFLPKKIFVTLSSTNAQYSRLRFIANFIVHCANSQAHIEDLNETQLKSLLDEAMDYKSPRDANDKSDTFKVSSSKRYGFYGSHNHESIPL